MWTFFAAEKFCFWTHLDAFLLIEKQLGYRGNLEGISQFPVKQLQDAGENPGSNQEATNSFRPYSEKHLLGTKHGVASIENLRWMRNWWFCGFKNFIHAENKNLYFNKGQSSGKLLTCIFFVHTENRKVLRHWTKQELCCRSRSVNEGAGEENSVNKGF